MGRVEVLDCTLRDGAYIVNGNFGKNSIMGIIDMLSNARVEYIECGWLKNEKHDENSTYFNVPSELLPYIKNKNNTKYSLMIDYNRYDVDKLSESEGYVDFIRVVFPHGKVDEGVLVGKKIKEKKYGLMFQLANTLKYTDSDLIDVCKKVNEIKPYAIYVVDTFGAMYEDDLDRIIDIIDKYLDKSIKLGIHTHNNRQLAFSLSIQFVNKFKNRDRDVIVDSSLSGMGRGAGNATTELVSSYLNKKYDKHYDLDNIMDAIDTYMTYYEEHFRWGYSTSYFIAGLYCSHVNNIAYLLKEHNTNSKDMRAIIESLSDEERLKYDYDILEKKYIANQNRKVDDSKNVEHLKKELMGKDILIVAPGKTIIKNFSDVEKYVLEKNPIVIGANAIVDEYKKYYDYLFFVNLLRYNYAKNKDEKYFDDVKKIVLSNIKSKNENNNCKDIIINYEHSIKAGYKFFDNAVISLFRFLDFLEVKSVNIAGFDGFSDIYNESYADANLPSLNVNNSWEYVNSEIKNMFEDFLTNSKNLKNINFITDSIFNEVKGI